LKILLVILMFFVNPAWASPDEGGAGNHFKLEDFKSLEEAKISFLKNNELMRVEGALNSSDVHRIHVITYKLEKSLELFIKNTTGEKQKAMTELAVALENVHVSSEHNDLEGVEKKLGVYFNLVDQFLFGF